MWSEAVTVYGNIVQQNRRDIQCAVLGKGPYDLSSTHCHLPVTASSWLGMNRTERERHLTKLGTSITEDIEEDNKEQPLTQTEVIGSFKDSGLPEFLKGSWTNVDKIVQLNGIGSFPNDDSRRIVISLSSPLSNTVQIARKKLACVDCPRFNECGICAHTLAVAHHLGMLSGRMSNHTNCQLRG